MCYVVPCVVFPVLLTSHEPKRVRNRIYFKSLGNELV